jgi:hypothetical protein
VVVDLEKEEMASEFEQNQFAPGMRARERERQEKT